MGWQLLEFFSSTGDAGVISVKRKGKTCFLSAELSVQRCWNGTALVREGDGETASQQHSPNLVHFGMLPHTGPNTSSLKTGNPEYYFK